LKKYNNKTWQHVKTLFGGEKCELFGVNIFDYEWKDTNQKVIVPDNLYNQPLEFYIYEVEIDGKVYEFGIKELKMCVYGFCILK